MVNNNDPVRIGNYRKVLWPYFGAPLAAQGPEANHILGLPSDTEPILTLTDLRAGEY